MIEYLGSELKKRRRAMGLNQTEFGKLIGFARCTVSYWETKPVVKLVRFSDTPSRICEALGLKVSRQSTAHARIWGISDSQQEARDRLVAKMEQELLDREARRTASRRVICGAKTRKGLPCRMKSEPGRRRCKFHGGKSTGPKTPEGRARIAEAQRKRWATARLEKGQ